MLFCFCGHSLQNFMKLLNGNDSAGMNGMKGMNVEGMADLGKSQWTAIIVINSKKVSSFIHISEASNTIETGNPSMRENLVVTSSTDRPSLQTLRVGDEKGSPRHAAYFCLGLELTSLEGTNRFFLVKI